MRFPHIVLWTMLCVVGMSLVAVGCRAQPVGEDRGARPLKPAEAQLLGGSVLHVAGAATRWSRADLRHAGGIVVGLAALSSVDDAGRSFMRRNQSERVDPILSGIERFGTVENFAVLGGIWLAGAVSGDIKARHVAVEGAASSLIAAAVITPALQRVAGRVRPRHDEAPHTFRAFSGNISFPSGHTTQAFAVASVIASEYDHPAVQFAAYGAATGVAAARMYHDAHFVSDVATAALIGTVVGRAVVQYGRARRTRVNQEE